MADNSPEFPCVVKSSTTTLIASLNRDELEKRRLEAVQDLLTGQPQSAVACKFRVSRTTASRWNRALRQKGVESLRKRRATGRPCRLTREQLLQIPDIFAKGAIVHGFPDNRWTSARLATAIEARFGVRYAHDHVARLMRKVGLSGPRTGNAQPLAAAHAASYSYTPGSNLTSQDMNVPHN